MDKIVCGLIIVADKGRGHILRELEDSFRHGTGDLVPILKHPVLLIGKTPPNHGFIISQIPVLNIAGRMDASHKSNPAVSDAV